MSDRPQSFFKYMTAATARIVLDDGRLRWSRPSRFNDPFDMQVNLQIRFDRSRVINATLGKMWERVLGRAPAPKNELGLLLRATAPIHLQRGREAFLACQEPGILKSIEGLPRILGDLNDQLQAALATTKIICLSARKDSVLMWSHYAESHGGIALEFRVPDGVDSPYKIARPVNYCDEVPCLFTEDELSDFLSGGIDLTHEIADRILYAKAMPWRYEEEWRIATGDGRKPMAEFEDVEFFREELCAVYFGCRAVDQDRAAITELVRARYPWADIWQCRRSLDAWALAFERLPV
ncbi:DUF2971 domain-containing protein [Dyella japonica]|uniref:DUF2971 domain-containing protein n=1 Tax=Dyella japonica TaxID=231455 RepID=A0ABV2K198_9GAMM